jgi:hypothetical protein
MSSFFPPAAAEKRVGHPGCHVFPAEAAGGGKIGKAIKNSFISTIIWRIVNRWRHAGRTRPAGPTTQSE